MRKPESDLIDSCVRRYDDVCARMLHLDKHTNQHRHTTLVEPNRAHVVTAFLNSFSNLLTHITHIVLIQEAQSSCASARYQPFPTYQC